MYVYIKHCVRFQYSVYYLQYTVNNIPNQHVSAPQRGDLIYSILISLLGWIIQSVHFSTVYIYIYAYFTKERSVFFCAFSFYVFFCECELNVLLYFGFGLAL